jgi:hypothetical protein
VDTGPATNDERPCAICSQSAYTGRHEPYLVEDIRARLRLWRCSRCAAIWREDERWLAPVEVEEADRLAPGWRAAEAWLSGTTLRSLLVERAAGRVDDDWFTLALLHQEAWARPVVPGDSGPIAVYSGPDVVGAVDDVEPASVAWLVAMTSGRGRVVLDPWSTWRCELDGDLLVRLALTARGTLTDAERLREEARQAPERAARVAARLWYIPPHEALRHSRPVPEAEAVLFWEPLRGGRQLLIGRDDTVLAGSSALTLDQMVSAFREGRRTDPALVVGDGTR